MSNKVYVLYSGKTPYEFESEETYQQALNDGDEIAMYGERVESLPQEVSDSLNGECGCNGKCSVCVNALGRSQAVYQECPDCIIHGDSELAKAKRREYLAK